MNESIFYKKILTRLVSCIESNYQVYDSTPMKTQMSFSIICGKLFPAALDEKDVPRGFLLHKFEEQRFLNKLPRLPLCLSHDKRIGTVTMVEKAKE